ncbi:MAG: transcriptional regulator of arginine metabolism [Clostridia bacterium]|nr:transcriptional regulator of arginine metabolism [Clostridia bacterium]
MKIKRQKRILEIIKKNPIETQEELAKELKMEGFSVTQATVSRDIKELGLIKVPEGNIYRYAAPTAPNQDYNYARMVRLFQDSVVNIDHSGNLIVIKTIEGTANAVAFCIDRAEWDEVIGTIAGDDTILIIVKPAEKVDAVLKRFNELLE